MLMFPCCWKISCLQNLVHCLLKVSNIAIPYLHTLTQIVVEIYKKNEISLVLNTCVTLLPLSGAVTSTCMGPASPAVSVGVDSELFVGSPSSVGDLKNPLSFGILFRDSFSWYCFLWTNFLLWGLNFFFPCHLATVTQVHGVAWLSKWLIWINY